MLLQIIKYVKKHLRVKLLAKDVQTEKAKTTRKSGREEGGWMDGIPNLASKT